MKFFGRTEFRRKMVVVLVCILVVTAISNNMLLVQADNAEDAYPIYVDNILIVDEEGNPISGSALKGGILYISDKVLKYDNAGEIVSGGDLGTSDVMMVSTGDAPTRYYVSSGDSNPTELTLEMKSGKGTATVTQDANGWQESMVVLFKRYYKVPIVVNILQEGIGTVPTDKDMVGVTIKDNSGAIVASVSCSDGEEVAAEVLGMGQYSVEAKWNGITIGSQIEIGLDGTITGLEPITFLVDTKAPVIRKVEWKSVSSGDYQEITEDIVITDKESITLKLTAADAHLEKAELYGVNASGNRIKKAEALVPKNHTVSSCDFEFSIEQNAEDYSQMVMVVTDKAGNQTQTEQSITAIIDGEAPELTEEGIRQTPEPGIWFSNTAATTPMSITIALEDYSMLQSVLLEAENGECFILNKDNSIWNQTGRNAMGKYTYRITTKEDFCKDIRDQDLSYDLMVTDVWGNKMDTRHSVTIRVDNTGPDDTAYIAFEGDWEHFYDPEGKAGNANEFYVFGSQAGTLFNKELVTLHTYIRDLPAEDAIDGAASGIAQVEINYSYTEESIGAEKPEKAQEKFTLGGDRVISQPVKMTVNGEELALQQVSFPLKVEKNQKIVSLDSLVLTDGAGNKTTIDSFQGVKGDQITYVLDHTAPVLEVHIPAGTGNDEAESSNPAVVYYNRQMEELAAVIQENNFYSQDVETVLKTDKAEQSFISTGFVSSGYTHRSTLGMSADGTYQFAISYADRSGNSMVAKEGCLGTVTDGTYVSPLLVLDTVAPQIDIQYYRDGSNTTESVQDGNWYNSDITAVVSVREKYFAPELVNIQYVATSAEDNRQMEFQMDPSAWEKEGDVYRYTIPCSEEGTYHISAACKDKAGNPSNQVEASYFHIDKSLPVVEVSYNLTVENAYYNKNRVATVTVTDQSFDEDNLHYDITTTGPEPELSEWSHLGGQGCDGQNHVKSCQWTSTVTFSRDGDYSFAFGCMDKAGNSSEVTQGQRFTIDKTIPVIRVSYDNNRVQNERYYQAPRRATISIQEHNFDAKEVGIEITAPEGVAAETSSWRQTGEDIYTATVAYDKDGEYSFQITCKDRAGNASAAYPGDSFIIDLTPPVLSITGVENHSANNGKVAPQITCSDKNFDVNGVDIQVEGANIGAVSLERQVEAREDGQTFQYLDFQHAKEYDDLYTLRAKITDKAGNSTEESLLFSVNRFGSVYNLSRDTEALLEQFYVQEGPDITITETNVDTLEFREITYSCDGEIVTLEEGVDYRVEESGSEYEWKQYTYHIEGKNFGQEGVYAITIRSVDRASNNTNNRVKEKNIEFVVDKTAPSIVIGGVEEDGRYREAGRTVTIDAVDNVYLKEVRVFLNNQLAKTFTEEEITAGGDGLTFLVEEAESWQNLYVAAVDAAGNQEESEPLRFLITSNAFVQWRSNTPLFVGSITGTSLAVTGTGFAIAVPRLRRRKVL